VLASTVAVALCDEVSAFADEPPANWDAFQAAHSLTCWAKDEPLKTPQTVEYAGYRYTFSGTSAQVRKLKPSAKGAEIKLGVLSGIKELDADTKNSLDHFYEAFKKAGVEAILVGGDNAEDESKLGEVFDYLAATDLPTYVVIGNWEGRAPFNRALRNSSAKHPNLINMQFVRRLDAEGYDVISLGGYYDRQYVRNTGGCIYKPEDVDALADLAKSADDPVILLMHGPPKQSGKDAIDYVPEAGNVGDVELAKVMTDAKIPFGIFGHILEAAMRATDANGKPVAAGKYSSTLFVNPGAANSLPWKLNNGKTTYGSAAVFTLKGKMAKVEYLSSPKPEPKAVETVPE
jgi:Icc-related predicted phosphoesterase